MNEVSRVFCVLFDGANKDVTFGSSIKMPALRSFVKNGLFVHSNTVLPSNSECARHAAFSGSYPSVSGILTNNPTETVFDVAALKGYTTIVSGGWEGDSYSINNSGSVSVFNAPSADSVNDMYLVKGKKGEATSRKVVDTACRFIDRNLDFKIVFIDFLDSDCVGHRFKETSNEYKQALEYEDEEFNRFVTRMKHLNLIEDSLWIIFTDHSMLEGNHGDFRTLENWIVLSGDIIGDYAKGAETVGTVLDICPTICSAIKIRKPTKCRATPLLERVIY
jgi:predicted AlkP superfamily pyrophosphatase or phosphodiesterase